MKEYQVAVGNVLYSMGELREVTIHQPLFDAFSAGNACTAKMSLSFYKKEDPPKMARICPFYRDSPDEVWKPLGVFYIDERSESDGVMTLQAYDGMLRSEKVYVEEGDTGEWPRGMWAAAQEIAQRMGVALDGRTVLNNTYPYEVEYPSEYTMHEVLCHIAAAHAGNWIMTDAGKLWLVPLFSSMPPETHILINQDGDAILFGDTRILI